MLKKSVSALICAILSVGLMGCGDTSKASKDTTNVSKQETKKDDANSTKFKIKFGKLESAIVNADNVLVIKAKINPSYNNTSTIDQNFHNVEDIILHQNGNKYKEIQYWAVADMKDGSESKAISFTVNKNLIENIKKGNVVAMEMKKYVSDLWILPTLKQ